MPAESCVAIAVGILVVMALALFKLWRATRGYDEWNTARRAFMTEEQRDQDILEEWQDRQY